MNRRTAGCLIGIAWAIMLGMSISATIFSGSQLEWESIPLGPALSVLP